MKILFLDQFSDMGGAQHGLLDTIDAVQNRGWQALAAIPGSGPLVKQLASRGVPVISIPCGPYRSTNKTATDVFRFVFDLRRQASIVKKVPGGLDLLYVNGPRLLPGASLASGEVPVLFHAHSHIQQTSVRKLAGLSLRHAGATVVACSRSVLEPLRSYVAPDRAHVIPNGVRDIPFRQRVFLPEKGWRIGIIGRISPEKGQAEFLCAARLLHPEFPKARFVVCGASLFADPGYYKAVQDLASGLPVEFLGWREDVASVFADLDLLVVPSKYEGLGRVVIEAFAAGVPVVAFATGGIPELIAEGETGFLVSEISPEALAARIRAIIGSDPAILQRVATTARTAWERFYSVDVYKARMIEFIERLAPASRAGLETEAPLPTR